MICCRNGDLHELERFLKIDHVLLFNFFRRVVCKQGALILQGHKASLVILLLPMHPQNITEISLTIVDQNWLIGIFQIH